MKFCTPGSSSQLTPVRKWTCDIIWERRSIGRNHFPTVNTKIVLRPGLESSGVIDTGPAQSLSGVIHAAQLRALLLQGLAQPQPRIYLRCLTQPRDKASLRMWQGTTSSLTSNVDQDKHNQECLWNDWHRYCPGLSWQDLHRHSHNLETPSESIIQT